MHEIILTISIILSIISIIVSVFAIQRSIYTQRIIDHELAKLAKIKKEQLLKEQSEDKYLQICSRNNERVLEESKEPTRISLKEEDIPISIPKVDRPAVTFGIEER